MANKSIRVADLRDALKACPQEIAADLTGEAVRTVRAKLKSGEYREVGKGKVDVVQALDAQRHGRQAPAISLHTARLKRAQAEKVETENAVTRRRLIPAEEVGRVVSVSMAVVARMLTALDRRLPPLVTGMGEPAILGAKIRKEVNLVREAAAAEFRKLASPGG